MPRVSRSSSFVLRVSHFSFRPHSCPEFLASPSALIRPPNFSPPRPPSFVPRISRSPRPPSFVPRISRSLRLRLHFSIPNAQRYRLHNRWGAGPDLAAGTRNVVMADYIKPSHGHVLLLSSFLLGSLCYYVIASNSTTNRAENWNKRGSTCPWLGFIHHHNAFFPRCQLRTRPPSIYVSGIFVHWGRENTNAVNV